MMKYILIGSILGSLVTSSHDNEEACRGRQEMLRKEKQIHSECYLERGQLTIGTGAVLRTCDLNGRCN